MLMSSRIFRGYDFSIFIILLSLERYFEGFDLDLRASLCMFSYGVSPGNCDDENV